MMMFPFRIANFQSKLLVSGTVGLSEKCPNMWYLKGFSNFSIEKHVDIWFGKSSSWWAIATHLTNQCASPIGSPPARSPKVWGHNKSLKPPSCSVPATGRQLMALRQCLNNVHWKNPTQRSYYSINSTMPGDDHPSIASMVVQSSSGRNWSKYHPLILVLRSTVMFGGKRQRDLVKVFPSPNLTQPLKIGLIKRKVVFSRVLHSVRSFRFNSRDHPCIHHKFKGSIEQLASESGLPNIQFGFLFHISHYRRHIRTK